MTSGEKGGTKFLLNARMEILFGSRILIMEAFTFLKSTSWRILDFESASTSAFNEEFTDPLLNYFIPLFLTK